jgi:hypothetical protein
MGKIYTSADVYFDENFNSTLAYEQNKFSGYTNLTITEPMPDTDLPYYQTGSAISFGRKHTPGTMQFAQPHTELLFDDALKMFDGNKRVVEEIKDYYIVDDDKVQLYVKFLGEQQTIWIDYKCEISRIKMTHIV